MSPDQKKALAWFFSDEAEDMTLAEVRTVFAAVGWRSAEDVKAAIFPATVEDS